MVFRGILLDLPEMVNVYQQLWKDLPFFIGKTHQISTPGGYVPILVKCERISMTIVRPDTGDLAIPGPHHMDDLYIVHIYNAHMHTVQGYIYTYISIYIYIYIYK